MPRDRRNAIHQAGARLAEYTDRLWTGGETLKTPLICQTGPNRSAKSGWFCSI
jgi:hypothetical protein